MPHDIASVNGKAAMAYQGEMPWHRLGVKMTGQPDVYAALKAASLDWFVDLQPMFLADSTQVPGRQAVVRDTDRKILATVSDDYEPVQNNQAFSVLQPACEKFGVTIESAGALGRGHRVWMLAKMPESAEPIPGDRIDSYFLILTGHDGHTPFTARPTPIRVVCANTLEWALHESESVFKLVHVAGANEQLVLVEEMILTLAQSFQTANENFTKLVNKRWNQTEVGDYVDEVFGIENDPIFDTLDVEPENKHSQEVLYLVWNGHGAELAGADPDGTGATAWAAYNGVTEYVDHVRPAKSKTKRSIASANKSAVFGSGARIKARALALALAD